MEPQANFQEYEQQDYNQWENYEESNNYLDEDYEEPSQKKHFQECQKEKVYEHIYKEINEIMNLTNLDFNWCIILYSMCRWKMEEVHKNIDKYNSHLNLIHWIPDYYLEVSEPEFCFLCEKDAHTFYKNSCGHRMCLDSWKLLLRNSLQENQLIPNCQQCGTLMNYRIIDLIISNPDNIQLNQQFQQLLFTLYAKSNSTVRVCPNKQCNRLYFVHRLKQEPIQCQCSALICVGCGEQYHYYLTCEERECWANFQLSEKTIIKDIKGDGKTCPKCFRFCHKSYGSLEYICPECNCLLCWVCWKPWKDECFTFHGLKFMEIQTLIGSVPECKTKYNNTMTMISKYKNIQTLKDKDIEEVSTVLQEKYKYLPDDFKFIKQAYQIFPKAWKILKTAIIHDFINFNCNQTLSAEEYKKSCYEFCQFVKRLIRSMKLAGKLHAEWVWLKDQMDVNPEQLFVKNKPLILENMKKIQSFIDKAEYWRFE